MNARANPRGQALILLVFAIIGLIGMVALTVDGGNAYSDRRHAQNAADTAVLAGGRAIIRGEAWKPAALAIANENGFDDSDDSTTTTATMANVEVYRCDEPGAAVDCGLYDIDVEPDAAHYIQVKITSTVNTYFAPVIGIPQVTNVVQAIARALPPGGTANFLGQAVVAFAPNVCQAVKYQGTADTLIRYSGIFSNSDCSDSSFFNNSSSAQLTAPSLCTVGGITYTPGAIDIPSMTSGCAPLGWPPPMVMPNPTCGAQTATQTGTTMSPGNYTGVFPPNTVTDLQSGVYCIHGDFRLNAGQLLRGTEVVFSVEPDAGGLYNGDVVWNGSAQPELTAPSTGDFAGLLVYVPMLDPIDYSRTVRLNGNSDSIMNGTILAPSSQCIVEGTGDLGLVGQVMCYTVELTGTSGITISYNDLMGWNAVTQPTLQLTE